MDSIKYISCNGLSDAEVLRHICSCYAADGIMLDQSDPAFYPTIERLYKDDATHAHAKPFLRAYMAQNCSYNG